MCATKKWKIGMLAIAMVFICGSVNAQRFHRHLRYPYYPPYYSNRIVTVEVHPDVISVVNNRLNQKERLAMAIAYLETHEYLTIRQYAKMTHLSMASAEAELDAFVMDKKKPIRFVIRGKKKVYIKRI